MIAAINEFERQNLLERQREGIAIAKKAGKYKGGQVKKIDDALFDAAYERYKTRQINKVQFAKELQISRPRKKTFMSELAETMGNENVL